jgi:hypothetical protein
MSWPSIRPPHSKEWRDILRKAGMSENSELTADEALGVRSAIHAYEQNPRIPGSRLYRIIRPRKAEFDAD